MRSSLAMLSHTASWYRLIQQLGIMLYGGQFGPLSIVDLVGGTVSYKKLVSCLAAIVHCQCWYLLCY